MVSDGRGIDAFADWFDLPAADWLRPGRNTVQLRATAVEGPAAVAVRLHVRLADGSEQVLDTGANWQADGAAVAFTPSEAVHVDAAAAREDQPL